MKIDALNDSRLIGMCLYNVVVLSAVGLTLNLALEDKVALLYGINSGILLIGTTGTMLVVFIPKVNILLHIGYRYLRFSPPPPRPLDRKSHLTHAILTGLNVVWFLELTHMAVK